MDSVLSEDTVDGDNNQNNTFVISNAGEVSIQLKDSHTTSSDTDAQFNANKGNEKFHNEQEHERPKLKDEANNKSRDEQEYLNEISSMQRNCGEQKANGAQQMAAASDEVSQPNCSVKQKTMEKILKERHEIFQRLEEIVDMFDAFTRNVESLQLKKKTDPVTNPATERSRRKRRNKEWLAEPSLQFEEPLRQRTRFEKYLTDDKQEADMRIPTESKTMLENSPTTSRIKEVADHLQPRKLAVEDFEREISEMKAAHAPDISTAASNCELSDHHASLSFIEISSLVSTSEQTNSLNNYAQAENACANYYKSPEDIQKPSLTEQLPRSTVVSVQQPARTPEFSVITMEMNAVSPSAHLGRPSFRQRLWDVVCNFCAAILMCLKINKDFIFCLAFFLAFVVSASFLTAFFYHHIIISPTVWQTQESLPF